MQQRHSQIAPARAVLASSAAALALCAAASAQAQEGDTILPGWWSYSTSALLVVNKTERRCIRQADIERVMDGAINHHLHCDSPFRGQSFGPVAMSGVCTDKKGSRIPISMRGAFSPTRIDIRFQIAGLIPGAMHARRLSPTCPPSEQP